MKKITQTLIIMLMVLPFFARGAPPAKNWENFTPEQLKKHVANVKTFGEAHTLLGPPRSSDFSPMRSRALYSIGGSLTLIFSGERDYHLAKNDLLRPIRSISLFRHTRGQSSKLIWRMMTDVPVDPRIPYDHLDVPQEDTRSRTSRAS